MKPPRATLPGLTDRLVLGEAGLRVSPFCLGLGASEDTVCAAFEAGINFFFLTADLHWPVYEPLRRGLEKLLARGGGIREQLVVGVVSYATQTEFPAAALREAVEAVPGLGSIDIAIAGGAYSAEFPARLELYQDFRRDRYLGVRAIGTTFHDRAAAVLATNQNLVDIAFIRYNPAHFGARSEVFPRLTEPRRTLLYNFKSTYGFVDARAYREVGLLNDGWRPKITDYYRFALTRPELDGLLCAPRTPEQIRALAAALEERPLDTSEERYLIELGIKYREAVQHRA